MKTLQSISSIAFMILSILFFSACEKEECAPEVNENGLTRDITDLVPQEILDELERLGSPIFGGVNPPEIEGTFLASPFILSASNRPSDTPGKLFEDYRLSLKNQNNQDLTIDLDYENGPESGTGLGSYIVGEGNKFTIFVEVTSQNGNATAQFVHVISGELSEAGIKDLHFSNFMLDNNGNPTGVWIENGEGRVIYDSDGLSERI